MSGRPVSSVSRRERHRVAPPVAEPVIAGDDGRAIGIVGYGSADDELIGGQHELLDPGALPWLGPGAPPARQGRRVMRRAPAPGGVAIERGFRLGGHDQRQRILRRQLRANVAAWRWSST